MFKRWRLGLGLGFRFLCGNLRPLNNASLDAFSTNCTFLIIVHQRLLLNVFGHIFPNRGKKTTVSHPWMIYEPLVRHTRAYFVNATKGRPNLRGNESVALMCTYQNIFGGLFFMISSVRKVNRNSSSGKILSVIKKMRARKSGDRRKRQTDCLH